MTVTKGDNFTTVYANGGWLKCQDIPPVLAQVMIGINNEQNIATATTPRLSGKRNTHNRDGDFQCQD